MYPGGKMMNLGTGIRSPLSGDVYGDTGGGDLSSRWKMMWRAYQVREI